MTTPKKEKVYTQKQLDFLEHLFGDAQGNLRLAMKMAGYSPTANTADLLKSLQEEIIEGASTMLAANSPKAAFGLIGVLDDPSTVGAKNAVAAAKEVLDRAGLVKKEKVEVSSDQGGLFILPPKKVDD
jgi:hypothetical protein